MNNKKLFSLNKQGGLDFWPRREVQKIRCEPESLWYQPWLLVVIVEAVYIRDIIW
jgi:hypothetical protein